jgi:hypothetical protein
MQKIIALATLLSALVACEPRYTSTGSLYPKPPNAADLEAREVVVTARDDCVLLPGFIIWEEQGEGVIIGSCLVVSIGHILTRGDLCLLVSGRVARIVRLEKATDLLLIGLDENCEYFHPLGYELSPVVGMPAVILREAAFGLSWQAAGIVAEIRPTAIFLSGFSVRPGESGSPVYTQEGKLLGIVRGKEINPPHRTVIIPARCVLNILNPTK